MAATSGPLNVRRVRDTIAPGRYGDGGGLYARSDLFAKRRALMNTWARFATSQPGDVVTLSTAGR